MEQPVYANVDAHRISFIVSWVSVKKKTYFFLTFALHENDYNLLAFLQASIQNHLIELALLACLPANNAILWIQINASVVLQGNSFTIINAFLETIVQWVPMQTPPLKPVKIAL